MSTISVIVPIHNGSRFLAATLDAVLAQASPADELIVVDDGSTDQGAALAAARGLTVLTQTRQGVCVARNAGLAAARGDFVCFLDQDDIWHPQHLQHQRWALNAATDPVAVVSPYQHWHPRPDGQYAEPQTLFPPPSEPRLLPEFSGWVYHQFMRDCWALTSATLLRRESLLRHGAFDPSLPFSEDWQLWLRLSRIGRFAAVNGPPVLYRQHPRQGSRVPRDIDYRCRLLREHWHRHGLRSADGRGLPEPEFLALLAGYRMEYGYQHLQHGSRQIAIAALLDAWRMQPRRLRYLALATAALVGWRPGDTLPA
ncbi:MAG: glycosyltransferase family 2 protein [Burkholderiaceae bacterium]|nr:glycosyltransferase family 2 protein [Burkholderiaceae bacterium]